MAFMLGALELMQIFWTYYIFSSIVAVNVSDKIAKHTYDWNSNGSWSYAQFIFSFIFIHKFDDFNKLMKIWKFKLNVFYKIKVDIFNRVTEIR